MENKRHPKKSKQPKKRNQFSEEMHQRKTQKGQTTMAAALDCGPRNRRQPRGLSLPLANDTKGNAKQKGNTLWPEGCAGLTLNREDHPWAYTPQLNIVHFVLSAMQGTRPQFRKGGTHLADPNGPAKSEPELPFVASVPNMIRILPLWHCEKVRGPKASRGSLWFHVPAFAVCKGIALWTLEAEMPVWALVSCK